MNRYVFVTSLIIVTLFSMYIAIQTYRYYGIVAHALDRIPCRLSADSCGYDLPLRRSGLDTSRQGHAGLLDQRYPSGRASIAF